MRTASGSYRKTATLVPEFVVEDLPLSRTATLVPEVLVKNLPIGRALFKNAVLYFVGEMFVLVRPCINVGYIAR